MSTSTSGPQRTPGTGQRTGRAAPTRVNGPDDTGAAGGSKLQLRRVTFTHPGASAPTLFEVDLTVDSGQMLAVVGPSGSGKSSTLRVTAGLVDADAGDVLVGGVSLRSHPPERRGMSMLFQRPLLFPHLTVLDNVGFADRVAGRSRRVARARAGAYLELVHLAHLAGRAPATLSGGQEQRVALARALAAEPRVLLLDEPFSSLDAGVRATMHELLAEVRAALAPTTVIVTHDLDEAALADQVAVLVAGRVHQVDTVARLYRQPASREVARVLGGFAEIEGHVERGSHHSALGVLPLPDTVGVTAGPATALVRREALRTTSVDDPTAVLAGVVVAVRQRGLHCCVIIEPVTRQRTARTPRVEIEHHGGGTVTPGEPVGAALTGLPYGVLPAEGQPEGSIRSFDAAAQRDEPRP